MQLKIVSIIFLTFCIIPFSLFSAELTLSDVADAQDQASVNISSMSSEIESVTELGGKKQELNYSYSMRQDNSGNKQVMIKTTGVYGMQFLVDTTDMSVTYLMADGSTKKYTVDDSEKAEILELSGLNGMFVGNNMYAALGIDKKTATDASFRRKLDTDQIETASTKIRVHKRSVFDGDRATVEYENKKIKEIKDEYNRRLDAAEQGKATKDGAKKMKREYIEKLKANKSKVFKYMMARRVEKINLKSGMVEEQEIFNEEGDRIGHIVVRDKKKISARKRNKSNDGKELKQTLNEKNDVVEIDVPSETQVEMDSERGKSVSSTKLINTKINEDVNFEWQKPKKFGGNKK